MPAILGNGLTRFCVGRRPGGACTGEVAVSLGGMDFCNAHLEALLGALRAREELLDTPPTPAEAAGFRSVANAVVYYLGSRTTGHVKIGTTTRLRSRFMSLTSVRQEAVLLATEPGGMDAERRRHRQFALLRVGGEWFRKEPLLMQHVAEVRAAHGILETGDGRLPGWAIAPLRA